MPLGYSRDGDDVITSWILLGCGPSDVGVRSLVAVVGIVPDAVEFGDVVVPTEAARELGLTNGGKAVLEVDATLVDDQGVFLLAETHWEVEPDGSVVVPVGFAPPTYLDYAGELHLLTNDPESPELIVPLTGTGVYAPLPDIDVDPTVDFGDVAAPGTETLWFQLRNVGTADLHVDEVVQTGSGNFVIPFSPSNSVVGPGEEQTVLVTYTPVGPEGDNGTLTIPSDDPDEPEVTVLLIGNGGSDLEYPVALIDCPSTLAPPQGVTLLGTESYDPSGGQITAYAWTLVKVPSDSGAYLTTQGLSVTELWADLAGDYQVDLVVQNELGLLSPPAHCTLHGIPADDLHVELTWDTVTTDLDLHVAQQGATLFDEPDDCYFCNKTPAWGAAGETDDPRLDLDALGNGGPENINIESPSSGTYVVRVHYFADTSFDPPATAHVRVWLNGVLSWDGISALTRDDVWEVGQVNWPEGTFGVYPDQIVSTEKNADCD